MSIEYNEFGEVVSVNGLTTGQHLGMPMQDAIGTEESNQPYATQRQTTVNCKPGLDIPPVKTPCGNYVKTVNGAAPDALGNVNVTGGGGGEQIQTDWNQNDDTQPDFLKNKPFVLVNMDWETGILDRTPTEIYEIISNGGIVLCSVTMTQFNVDIDSEGNVTKLTLISQPTLIGGSTNPVNLMSYQFDADGVFNGVGVYSWAATKIN